MAFQYPVPAQVTAADYLARVAALWKDAPIVLTGHSKGNLAVYAAMNAEDGVKDRIERIYSLDGPGFPEAVVNSWICERERINPSKSCRTRRWWAWCWKLPNAASW